MSEEDRIKWNQRYAEDDYHKNNPVSLLQDWLPRLAPGKALDLACGAGRNALLLASAGYAVDALDIAEQGLQQGRARAAEQGLEIHWIEQDLDQPYAFDTDYDLIVVMWYVDLKLISRLCDCLAPGGYLLCEEHLVTDQPVIGPGSNRFRVAPGALREAASGLEVLHYHESINTNADNAQLASVQLVARKAIGSDS